MKYIKSMLFRGVIMEEERESLEEEKAKENLSKAEEKGTEGVEYSKYMQKKIEKAKKKALQYGYTVPELKYPLEKPNKNRTAISVFGYLILVFSILFTGAMAYLTYSTGLLTGLLSAFGLGSESFSESSMAKTFGLSQIGGILAIIMIIVIVAILTMIAGICVWSIVFGIRSVRVAKVSRQEMAKGYEVFDSICLMIILPIVAIVVMVVLVAWLGLNVNTWVICGVLTLGIILYITFAILLIVERSKEKKWFKSLPDDAQQDFIEYNDVIKKYSARTNNRKFGGFRGR